MAERFHVVDFVVLFAVMLVSLGIGVLQGFRGMLITEQSIDLTILIFM